MHRVHSSEEMAADLAQHAGDIFGEVGETFSHGHGHAFTVDVPGRRFLVTVTQTWADAPGREHNPSDAELSAAISRSLASGALIDAGAWMARELGSQHGEAGEAPFGDLDDTGSGDLMTQLDETDATTDDNYGYRVDLLNAYREAWEKAAGRFYPIGA